jgi:hypothetical protein
MRIRLRWLVVVVLLLVPSAVRAHDHTADVFFSIWSYEHASNLFGLQGAYALTIPDVPHLSLVGDLAFHQGSHDDNDVTQTTYMGGIRYMFAEGHTKHVPFAHVLVGVARRSGDLPSDTDLALAVGGGYEYLPNGDQSSGGWGIRLTADYIAGGEGFPRVSAGFVFRFDN